MADAHSTRVLEPEAAGEDVTPLRVLVADQHCENVSDAAEAARALGHDVVAEEVEVDAVGEATARLRPDIALVVVGASSDHAIGLIRRIVREASCPVIAILPGDEPAFVREAARIGVFASIVEADPQELRTAIEVTLERYRDFAALRGALGRRAVIEQAKGILMGRHDIDADAAFERLRERSQRTGVKVADLAAALVDSHGLLADDVRILTSDT